MIKQLPYFFLLIFISILISCQSDNKKSGNTKEQFQITNFNSKVNLKAQLFLLDSLNYAVDICVIPEHNLLLVTDLKNNKFLKAYNLTSLKLIKSFIEKGPGPNQQIICRTLQVSHDKKYLYATDTYKKKIFVYAVDDIVTPGKTPIAIADITLKSNAFNRPLIFNNKYIADLHDNYDEKAGGVLNVYNPSGDFLYLSDIYPVVDKKIDRMEQNFAFLSTVNTSRDGTALIMSYLHTDFISIYSNKGKLLKRVHGPDIFEPEIKNVSIMGGTMGQFTENTIKAFTGKPQMDKNDVLVLYDGKKVSSDYHVNTLLNFTSKLTPKTIYKLDKPVFTLDIDWNTRTAYCLSQQVNGYNLVKYQVK